MDILTFIIDALSVLYSILIFIVNALGYAFYMMWIFIVPASCILVMTSILMFFGLRWYVEKFGDPDIEITHIRRRY